MAGPDQGSPDGDEPAADSAEAVAALDDAYRGVTEMLGSLSEPDFLLPTRCLGWTVTDCLCHLLGDARRALTGRRGRHHSRLGRHQLRAQRHRPHPADRPRTCRAGPASQPLPPLRLIPQANPSSPANP
jgi:hypothetical protein